MTHARRPSDLIAGGILWVIAVIIWWQSTTWPAAADVAGNPVVLPRIIAGIMVVVGLALVLRRRPDPEEVEGGGRHRPRDTVLAVGTTVALALLLDPLGLIPAGILYVLVLQRLVGAPWRIAVPFAVATPVAIWLVFVTALHVPLPVGEIWSFVSP
ncbi:tripartite tricarboxylate transporter TctB family protein [Microvirga sp. BT689]|uniref:tripartite tricarboxylate transporter TctB family protein n=1 Tax=Microvirga arvi TaxID=2778731 RepID=UPI001950BBC8|nr:tripartite tricarboxylate transporter TctB family protein [Microvirga arvi]MBM6583447.1 tripartite tricarboxylate transporter TctB family protein [Microvirga arvi]